MASEERLGGASEGLQADIVSILSKEPWLLEFDIHKKLRIATAKLSLRSALKRMCRLGILVSRNDAGDYKNRYALAKHSSETGSQLAKRRELLTKGIPWIRYPKTKQKAVKMAQFLQDVRAEHSSDLDDEDRLFINSLIEALYAMSERVLPDGQEKEE